MSRAYVDRRVDDIAAAARAAQQAAERWRLVAPVTLRHGMNAIFRCGDVVLRVATPNAPARLSLDLSDVLADAGVPVVVPVRRDVVVVDGFSVTAWEHVEAVDAPVDWRAVGEVIRTVHSIPVGSLPDGLPRPSPSDFPWWSHRALLDEVSASIDAGAADGLRAAIDRYDGWDDFSGTPVVVCHGDVHPGNVMMTDAGPVLIDWDLLCLAPCGWDHSPLMTWTRPWGGPPGIYDAFADGYGWSARGDRPSEAFAELRLVSATLMRWRIAQRVPAARAEAERRLAYWRGDPDAATWNAQ